MSLSLAHYVLERLKDLVVRAHTRYTCMYGVYVLRYLRACLTDCLLGCVPVLLLFLNYRRSVPFERAFIHCI